MATRSRTLLFLQYRNSYARAPSSYNTDSETVGLMESSDTVIEMTALPPKCVDSVPDIDKRLERVRKLMTELEGMHRKHLLPGFNDRSKEEAAIERLTYEITSEFYQIKLQIENIYHDSRGSSNDHTDLLAKNVQKSLATKVQEVSSIFRKQQSSYLQRMQSQKSRKADILGIEPELSNEAAELLLDEDAQVQYTQSQLAVMEYNMETVDQREREVNQIAKSIQQLAEIFRDLQTLVIDQGTMLDRIDYNIEQTAVHVKDAVVQLDQGAKYQTKTRKRKLILLLILVILLLIVILVVKPKRR